jgi:hypothetical protein
MPHHGKRVNPGAFSHRERFPIQELFDDIAILRAHGVAALDPWWSRLGWDDKVDLQTEDVIRSVLDEQYRRAQMIYAEIVTTTFPGIVAEMAFFPSLPVRWNLTVVRRAPSDGGSSIYFNWSPVATWQQAGADVVFGGKGSSFEDVEVTRAALAALGRPNALLPRYNGFTQLSDFSGRQWNNHFDGATPAVHDVSSLLKDDLDRVFSSMPRRDDQ